MTSARPTDQRSERVLLTGGTGFIGAHLLSLLRSRGGSITSLQRSPTPLPGVAETLHLPRWTPEGIQERLQGRTFDRVFHLAGSGVEPERSDLETIFRINVDCLRALVESHPVSCSGAIIVAGTSAEYRTTDMSSPIREDAPLTFASPYGASKAAGSIAALAIAGALGIRLCVVRIFGVFGPGEKAHRLLPSLVSGLQQRRRVHLSDGRQVRDFLHVDDTAAGLMAVADAMTAKEAPSQHIVNLCSGHGVTVRQFAETVADLMAVPRQLLGFGDLFRRPHEVSSLVGDATGLRALTGWAPRYGLTEGIHASLDELFLQPIPDSRKHRQ
jgi:nucleoside-diphosphate-sugar epimerase